MRAQRYADLAAFRARAEPWLLGREAENNLLLGLLAAQHAEVPLLVATEDESGGIAAVALQTPPWNLLVAAAPGPALDAIVDCLDAARLELPGVNGPDAAAEHVADMWSRRRDLDARLHQRLRL